MKQCKWCEHADIPNNENQHVDDETGAIDVNGDWICDDCRDASDALLMYT